jgi:hypothetical protein
MAAETFAHIALNKSHLFLSARAQSPFVHCRPPVFFLPEVQVFFLPASGSAATHRLTHAHFRVGKVSRSSSFSPSLNSRNPGELPPYLALVRAGNVFTPHIWAASFSRKDGIFLAIRRQVEQIQSKPDFDTIRRRQAIYDIEPSI